MLVVLVDERLLLGEDLDGVVEAELSRLEAGSDNATSTRRSRRLRPGKAVEAVVSVVILDERSNGVVAGATSCELLTGLQL